MSLIARNLVALAVVIILGCLLGAELARVLGQAIP